MIAPFRIAALTLAFALPGLAGCMQADEPARVGAPEPEQRPAPALPALLEPDPPVNPEATPLQGLAEPEPESAPESEPASVQREPTPPLPRAAPPPPVPGFGPDVPDPDHLERSGSAEVEQSP